MLTTVMSTRDSLGLHILTTQRLSRDCFGNKMQVEAYITILSREWYKTDAVHAAAVFSDTNGQS